MKNIGIIKKSHLASILNSNIISETNESYLHELLDTPYYEIDVAEDDTVLIDYDTLETYDVDHIYNISHNIDSLKINFLNFEKYLPKNDIHIESLCIHARYINTILEDPKHEFYNIALELYYEIHLVKFTKNINERIEKEAHIKQLQSKIFPKNYTYITDNFIDFLKKKQIKNLELGWLPLSDEDINNLNKIKSLECIILQYNHNSTIKNLSDLKVKELIIYGNILSELPDLGNNKKIKELDFSGNSLSNIDFNKIPQNLNSLNIDNNLITEIDISNINSKIEYLSLNDNLLTKFICKEINNSIQYLSLRNNNLVINEVFYHFIDIMFPNLAYVDLRENNFQDRFGIEYINSNSDDNQLLFIKEYLNIIDKNYPILDEEKDYKKFTNYVTLTWTHSKIPFLLILKNIQNRLEDYLREITNKIFHEYGVYFCISNKLAINITINKNSLILNISSDSEFLLTDYYFKYLNLIYNEIEYRSNIKIIPTIDTSKKINKSVNYLKKIYGMDYTFGSTKKIDIIKIDTNDTPKLLILNNKSIATHYESLDNVVAVVITSKTASIYCINEKNQIHNTIDIYKKNKKCFELILRTSDEKENLKLTLMNPYLDENQFIETFVYIDNDVKKKVNILINSKHFSFDETNIISKNPTSIHPQLIINELHKINIHNNTLSFTS